MADALNSVRLLHRTCHRRREDTAPGGASRLFVFTFIVSSLVTNVKSAAEKAASKDPAQYCLSLDAMIEHEYPVPSYVADVFQKPEGQGWVETPKQEEAPEAQTEEQKKAKARILAIDCEMVGFQACGINPTSADNDP
jgi:hypothetical protein